MGYILKRPDSGELPCSSCYCIALLHQLLLGGDFYAQPPGTSDSWPTGGPGAERCPPSRTLYAVFLWRNIGGALLSIMPAITYSLKARGDG